MKRMKKISIVFMILISLMLTSVVCHAQEVIDSEDVQNIIKEGRVRLYDSKPSESSLEFKEGIHDKDFTKGELSGWIYTELEYNAWDNGLGIVGYLETKCRWEIDSIDGIIYHEMVEFNVETGTQCAPYPFNPIESEYAYYVGSGNENYRMIFEVELIDTLAQYGWLQHSYNLYDTGDYEIQLNGYY